MRKVEPDKKLYIVVLLIVILSMAFPMYAAGEETSAIILEE